MNRRRAIAFAGVVWSCVCGAPHWAQAQLQAIETRDLRLVYPGASLGFVAPYAARCFQNSLRFHRALFGYTPGQPINVVLDDASDYGNAGVWGAPRVGMSVHIAPSSFVYETGPSNERINFTMNHEVVHVVALDMNTGSERFFRGLFLGKVRETAEHPETIVYNYLTLPRRAAPRWYHEGIAVFLETWMAGGLGRAQGPYDEMVFRSMVRDSAHFYDPLGLESEGTKVDFQIGVNSYLYGTRFMNYLGYTYSPERVVDWVARRPGSRRTMTAQFRHVFGLPLGRAWSDWIDFEHRFQAANLDSIRRYPVTPARDLSRIALGSVSRAFVDSAGGELLAAVQYPGAVAHVAAVPLAGGTPRVVHEVKGPALYFVSSLAFDPTSRTLFFTTDNNEWRDLWTLDVATGRAKRLIRDARVGDLAFDRADGSLWGVRHFNGISALVRFEPPYTDYHLVRALPYGEDVYDLDVSPDGAWLSASYAEISGRQTLRLFHLDSLAAGDTTSRVLHDFGNTIPQSFVFDPAGKTLVGSSYYTGVSNIWRYDLGSGAMELLSNGETGFFRPVPDGSDSLIVFRYTGGGFVPARIAAHPLEDASAITFLGERVVDKHPVLRDWKVPPPSTISLDSLVTRRGEYRPLGRLGVTSVVPILEVYKEHCSFGLRAEASDPIGLSVVDASASVTPGTSLPAEERWHATAGYRRGRLSLRVRANPASFYDLFGPTKVSRKGYGGSVEYRRLLLDDAPRSIELTAGVDSYVGLERLPDAQNVAITPGYDKLVDATVQLSGKNLRASIGAVEYERGHQWKLIGSVSSARFTDAGGTAWRGFPSTVATLDVGAPLPIKNASGWIRTAGGYSPGARDEPFANFFIGGFGNNTIDTHDPKRYREYTQFPGVELDALNGTNFVRSMVDLNLPPLRFRRLGTMTLYAAWARLSVFGTAMATNIDDPAASVHIGNAGAQADLRLQLLTLQPLTLSVGYARAFQTRFLSDEWMVSLKVL